MQRVQFIKSITEYQLRFTLYINYFDIGGTVSGLWFIGYRLKVQFFVNKLNQNKRNAHFSRMKFSRKRDENIIKLLPTWPFNFYSFCGKITIRMTGQIWPSIFTHNGKWPSFFTHNRKSPSIVTHSSKWP